MQQKNVWLGVVGVVALGLAGWRFFGGEKQFKMASEFKTSGVCLVCKGENDAVFRKGENEPLKCPSCSEQAFYSWWYCNECHYRYVPDFLKDGTSTPKPNPFSKCGHCNCQSVAKFDPEFHTVKNSVALPKWPPK